MKKKNLSAWHQSILASTMSNAVYKQIWDDTHAVPACRIVDIYNLQKYKSAFRLFHYFFLKQQQHYDLTSL